MQHIYRFLAREKKRQDGRKEDIAKKSKKKRRRKMITRLNGKKEGHAANVLRRKRVANRTLHTGEQEGGKVDCSLTASINLGRGFTTLAKLWGRNSRRSCFPYSGCGKKRG